MNDLWCAGCRMDGDHVAAIVKIQGVPFCTACRDRFRGMPDILQTVIDWHFKNPLPKDESRIVRYGDEASDAVGDPIAPAGPKVTYKCICACGGTVDGPGRLLPGHHAKVMPPAGKPMLPPVHRGGPPVVTSKPATVRAVDSVKVLAQEPAKPIRAHSVLLRPRSEPAERDGTLERLEEVLAEAGKPREDDPVKVCEGFGKRKGNCTEELNDKNSSGLCKKCYASMSYHKNHPRRPVQKAPEAEAVAAPLVLAEPAQLQPPANGSAKNHVRFIMFDADVSEGNLAEMMSAITNALGIKQA